MTSITIIAAIGKDNELGYKNDLIWKIPADLTFFKNNTIGKYIVMGMNTLKSLPKTLPNRKYIVLTSKDINLDKSIKIVHSIEELLTYINTLDSEIMIIGGASIYKQMIKYADKLLLTEIDKNAIADAYFPTFNKEEWDKEIISTNKYNDINYKHVSYTRKLHK